MRYVYMNNFRGFTETLVPLKQTNFLVGENSTGKSSFLLLLSLVNQPAFWFNPSFSLRDELGLSSFADIVSAWSKDKTSFQVGVVTTEKGKSGKTQLGFSIHEFIEQDDSPRLVRHSKLSANQLTTVLFEKARTKYRIADFNGDYETARNWHYLVSDIIQLLFADGSPAGIKAALSILGICKNTLRLPLVPMQDLLHKELKIALEKLKVTV